MTSDGHIEEYRSGFSEYAKTVLDPEVNAVVVGYDPFINYGKVVKAASYLQRPGCLFIGTNCDSYLPSETNVRIPGTGSIIEFVAVAAEKRPVYIGKPEVLIRDVLKNIDEDFDPATTLMIGDRLDTDIRFAHECGFHALLVLTGVNSLEDAQRMQASNSVIHQKCVPHFYAPSVDSLVDLYDSEEAELPTGVEQT